MMKNKILLIICSILFISCENKYEVKHPNDLETINSGKLSFYCDDCVYDLLDSGFIEYSKQYPNVILTKNKASARNSMAQLLATNSRVIVLARDYLKDEDSLMKVFKVSPHRKIKIADDALVFFVKKDFPIDTLNSQDLINLFTQKEFNLDIKNKNEIKFAITNVNTSIFSNFEKFILHKNKLNKKLAYFNSVDSVKDFVLKSNGLGIAYLSHLNSDSNFKMIRIGFQDSSNAYISPKPVHQAYVLQNKYPFKVAINSYLLEDRQNLPYWFATYMGKEFKVQKYLLNKGIVPAYANIKLKNSD